MGNRNLVTKIIRAIVMTVMLSGCGATASPQPIVSVTSTSLPATEISLPSPTAAPTATPAPLCGIPAAASPTQASNPTETSAKFEPPDGQAYFGFTFKLWDLSPQFDNAVWGDMRPFPERICDSVKSELDGKTPTIIKVGGNWKSTDGTLQPFSVALDDIKKVQTVLGPTVIPMVEWQAGDYDSTESNMATTKDIAAGQYDDYIAQYAQDVKQYGQPLFIRLICGEFNGNWWQFCSRKANPNLTTADFVDAWKRVVDIFRKEGVTNVAWIWTPVGFPPPPQNWGRDPNWQAYYPGDDYVDWVGADLNDWGKPNWIDPIYKFGVAHGKPFFLAEFAIRHLDAKLTHKQEISWLTAMFDYFENHPKIKVISYFNYKNNPDPDPTSADHVLLDDGQVNYLPNANDFDQRLIAGGADIQALFSSRIANPRYVSTISVSP